MTPGSDPDVPPALQCDYPSCEQEAVNPTAHGPDACPAHHPDNNAREPEYPKESDINPAENATSSAATPTPSDDTDPSPASISRDCAQAALDDAITWFHNRINDDITDHCDSGDHPDRPTTAREWFRDRRGFEPSTIDEKRFGWAPSNASDRLVAYLHDHGHDRDAIKATGLFTDDLRLLWNGRYVFPYFDREGQAVYAIARATGGEGGGGAGYDGHPADFIAGKYAKLAHTKDHVNISEPIYGLASLEYDGPILITEGVADAVRAHEYGYACLSPVTTRFKQEHREALLDILKESDRPVYVVQDAERPPIDYTDEEKNWDALGIEQFGPGLLGGVQTASYLREHGVDSYLAELPRLGLDKVDLDDYLGEWSDTLQPVLAAAKPAEEHPAHGHRRGEFSNWDAELGDADYEEEHDELSEEDVKEALDHVSNSLPYDDWIQLAYAVHDWDSTAKGRRVFETWSRRSPKWEEPQSPRAIEWIWENASSGGQVTVATLIHRAQQGGWEPPRRSESDTDYQRDPTEAEVVLDPQRAWSAAGSVAPEDLDRDLSLNVTDDGKAWLCEGQRISDVVRGVAIDHGLIHQPDAPLTDQYADAYQRARDLHGAPLPEYLTAADAIDHFSKVIGAVRELTYWHLDEDKLTVTVTGRGEDVSGDAVRTLDPTPTDGWRDSDSGESVLVFPSGTIWDADLGDGGQVIDALRFVALDSGLIDDPSTRLKGETFSSVYQTAREEYGAPLPRWQAGDPESIPILPPAEDLVDDIPTTSDGPDIDSVREDVEDLYRDMATDNDQVHVLSVLPALGKTTSAIKTASDQPTAYFAPRKELMAAAATKAKSQGLTHCHLPILSEATINEEQLLKAVEHVRDRGLSVLKNRYGLLAVVDEDELEIGSSSDDVQLDRATCPTAEGEHGEEWALAVHIARELDYTPRDIHERSQALFGSVLPCQCEEQSGTEQTEKCEYSEGWESVADPDNPINLVIGHYNHANVESARTHYSTDGNGRTKRTPRTIVLDEYPGLAYGERFGEEIKHHISWMAGALNNDIHDLQDLLEANLWEDEFVRAWLKGSVQDSDGPAADAIAALGARAELHEAIETAQEFLNNYPDLLRNYSIKDHLEQVVEDYPNIDGNRRANIGHHLRQACDIPADAPGHRIMTWLADDIADPLCTTADYDIQIDLDAIPGGGELRSLLERAIEGADNMEDGAAGRLRAARDALAGGDDGAREVAVWAQDGYAHRRAHYLLEAAIKPDDDETTARIETQEYTYGEESATLKRTTVGPGGDSGTVILDRHYNGGEILAPPNRSAGGSTCPLIGLDATARQPLWSLSLGESVSIEDVHSTPRERAEALRDLHDLRIVQTSDLVKSYEGDPSGKNLDADIALLEEIADEFTGVHTPRSRDEEVETLGKPAVVTTKVVRQVLEGDSRAQQVVSRWENYGNLKGSNDLKGHRLAALLGCQHYGDAEIERMAAFGGEEVTRQGRGHHLDYNSEIANEYLGHMQQDQVMQAALRFARGDSGAIVCAHTAALRPDLPIVGEGQVVKSWSSTASAIANEWRRQPGGEFTVSDVADAVDVTKTQVRRILSEFTEAGYLERHDPGEGLANKFRPTGEPGAGEAEIDTPSVPTSGEPTQDGLELYYTANVRVVGVGNPALPRAKARGSTLPAPQAVIGGDRAG